jgi:predicted  nucleic acid-binding Zn-ribbon protein
MKKITFVLAVAAMLTVGTIFTNCQSSDQKVDDAKTKVQEAKEDLKDVQKDAEAQKAADAEEWKIFKSETELKIKENETRIAELNAKMNMSGKKIEVDYSKKIEALKQKNKDMQSRMETYDKGQSDWATFKREFNHDMDELGQAFKDLAVDNKK